MQIALTQKQKKRKGISRKACETCRKAHACCSEQRPCKRCQSMGVVCFDLPSKKRGRKRKFVNSDEKDESDEKQIQQLIQKDQKDSPVPLKTVLPKTTSTLDNSRTNNKEYRKFLYGILFPTQKEVQEGNISMFWDLLDKFMIGSYVQRQMSKQNIKLPIIKYACSLQNQPSNSGEVLMCYQHGDCIKKEFYNRYIKEKSIEEEEKKEKFVYQASEPFQQLLDSCEVAIVLFNIDDGGIVSWNSKAKDILSFDEKDITKLKNWMEIVSFGFLPTNWDGFSKMNIKVDPNSKSFLMDYKFFKSNKQSKVVQIDSQIGTFLDMKYSILIFSENLIGNGQ